MGLTVLHGKCFAGKFLKVYLSSIIATTGLALIQIIYSSELKPIMLPTWKEKDCQSRRGRSKISDEDIIKILADERSYEEIAEEYQIHASQISRIKHGHSYKHVLSVHARETKDTRSIRWHR